MRIKNISAYGALDVPLLGREGEPYDEHGEGCLAAGESVEVTEEQARRLLDQDTNFAPDDAEAQAIVDELAAEREALAQLEDGRPPATSALHAVWIAYAESKGDTEAAKKTKKQLVAEYGADQGEGNPA